MPTTEEMILQAIQNLDKKIDSLDSRMDLVDRTLVKQEANLGEHMRRTELAEKSISAIKEEMKPIKAHVSQVEGGLKLLGLIASAVAVASAIWSFFS